MAIDLSDGLGIDDILGAAMGVAGGKANQGNPMGDILGSILGGMGGGVQQQQPQQQAPSGIGDILGGILGGDAQQQQAPSGIGDILGGILGGGAQQQPQQQQAPSGMGGMGILGDILGGILGGGNSAGAMAQNGIVGSIVNGLAKKTGLPPMIIYMAVTFIMGKLMNDARKPQRQQMPQQMPQDQAQQQQGGGMNLDDILGRMQQGKAVDKSYIQKQGLAEELSSQIGLSPEKSGELLNQIMGVLGQLPRR